MITAHKHEAVNKQTKPVTDYKLTEPVTTDNYLGWQQIQKIS
jgi:hypothetical protein